MGTIRLAALATSIDDLLALDPSELDDDELHDTVVGLQRHTHRLAAARAALVSVWDRRRCWAADGSRSAGHRLAREASMSIPADKREVRRASALASMPHTRKALAAGALSPEHVDLLDGANSGSRQALFESHEETLVEQAKLLRFGDCHRRAAPGRRPRRNGQPFPHCSRRWPAAPPAHHRARRRRDPGPGV